MIKNLRVDFFEMFAFLCEDLQLDQTTTTYLLKRGRKEGIYFFSVVLPKFSKHVLSSLEKGVYVPFRGFPRRKTCPFAIFSRDLNRLFDYKSGNVRRKPSASALRRIRQICEYFDKLVVEITSDVKSKAIDSYLKTEQEIVQYNNGENLQSRFVDSVRKNIETHYGLVPVKISSVLENCRPRFGPGTFAEWSQSKSRTVKNHLEYKMLLPSLVPDDLNAFSGYFKKYPSLKFRSEPPKVVQRNDTCEVLFVPKTVAKARSISQEPLATLPLTMSYFDYITRLLERVTCNRINFYNQEINRELAREGSFDTREWATLDLSSASDSIPYSLCKKLFWNIPFMRFFLSHRSTRYIIKPSPAERAKTDVEALKQPLRKLSGMGSGLTFPTMALIIHATICTAISKHTGRPYKEVSKDVYVYGDDIIIRRRYAALAIDSLKKVNFTVNQDKSFIKGFFRESCGGDYFLGKDVTPVRLRLTGSSIDKVPRNFKMTFGRPFPNSFKYDTKLKKGFSLGPIECFGDDTFRSTIVSLEAHCRELYRTHGRMKLIEYLLNRIEKAIEMPLHFTHEDTPYLGSPYFRMEPKDDFLFVIKKSSCVIKCKNQISPYSYLRDFFKSSFENKSLPYGLIAEPRKVNLKCELVRCESLLLPNAVIPGDRKSVV